MDENTGEFGEAGIDLVVAHRRIVADGVVELTLRRSDGDQLPGWEPGAHVDLARRIRDDGELEVAGRLWTLSHGSVLLEIAGFFGDDGRGLTEILAPLTVDVLVGMGDDRERTERSLAAALAMFADGSAAAI